MDSVIENIGEKRYWEVAILCVFCVAAFEHLQCLPSTIQYTIYALCILMASIVIVYLKTALVAIFIVFKAVFSVVYHFYRIIRGTTRLTMIGGVHVGRRLRQSVDHTQQILNGIGMPNQTATLLVLLALLSLVSSLDTTCNNHMIVTSSITECEDVHDKETCKLTTHATITLENLKFSQCLWFQDENKNNIFSLSIKLSKVRCNWNTQRQYFTFPTDLKTVAQVTCPQNALCGWGEHCVPAKSFIAETTESKQYPGVNRCIAMDSGSSTCTIIDSQGYLFYRAFLVPDHLRTYEVRAITGYSCFYDLEITESMNATSQATVTNHVMSTTTGVKIHILGAYDQPTQLMQNSFIMRVGKQREAYIEHAAPAGIPQYNAIGQVQANSSLTNSFIFDENSIQCSAYEKVLHCHMITSALNRMVENKVAALPRTIGYHYFYINENEQLMSELLFSKPVNVHLSFEDYDIVMERRTVCPKFHTEEITAEGCYACNPLARLTFMAYSSCAEGTVSVSFQRITVATSALKLGTTPEKHIVEFKAETRCISDKLCLYGRTVHTCQPLTFCLENPNLEILHPNLSALAFYANRVAPNQWFAPWTNISASFVSQGVRFLLLIFLSVFLFVFTCSTMLSFCNDENFDQYPCL